MEGQEIVGSSNPVVGVATTVHAEAPPVGSVEPSTTSAGPAPATHSLVEGQEMLVIARSSLSPAVAVQAEAPPVGSVEVTMLGLAVPGLATPPATHRLVEGLESASNDSGTASWAALQAAAPPVGSVEVTTIGVMVPPPGTMLVATQSDVDGQLTGPSVLSQKFAGSSRRGW